MKKLSLVNGQLSVVNDGGASRIFKDAAPKAHPKLTNDNWPLTKDNFFL
jgi:hypothetical protein